MELTISEEAAEQLFADDLLAGIEATRRSGRGSTGRNAPRLSGYSLRAREVDEGTMVGSVGRVAASGALTGLSSLADAGGFVIDEAAALATGDGSDTGLGDMMRGVGDGLRTASRALIEGMDDEDQAILEAAGFSGNLLEPDTWDIDGSPYGITLQLVSMLGQQAPMLLGAPLGPAGVATVAGLQAGGSQVREARETVEELDRAGELVTVPLYQTARVRGMDHEEAKQYLINATERVRGATGFALGGAGGAFLTGIPVGRFGVRGIERSLGLGRAGRVGLRAGTAATGEAATELAESVLSDMGTNLVLMDTEEGQVVDPWENTFADAVSAMMLGGTFGAAGGLLSRRPGEAEDEDETGRPRDRESEDRVAAVRAASTPQATALPDLETPSDFASQFILGVNREEFEPVSGTVPGRFERPARPALILPEGEPEEVSGPASGRLDRRGEVYEPPLPPLTDVTGRAPATGSLDEPIVGLGPGGAFERARREADEFPDQRPQQEPQQEPQPESDVEAMGVVPEVGWQDVGGQNEPIAIARPELVPTVEETEEATQEEQVKYIESLLRPIEQRLRKDSTLAPVLLFSPQFSQALDRVVAERNAPSDFGSSRIPRAVIDYFEATMRLGRARYPMARGQERKQIARSMAFVLDISRSLEANLREAAVVDRRSPVEVAGAFAAAQDMTGSLREGSADKFMNASGPKAAVELLTALERDIKAMNAEADRVEAALERDDREPAAMGDIIEVTGLPRQALPLGEDREIREVLAELTRAPDQSDQSRIAVSPSMIPPSTRGRSAEEVERMREEGIEFIEDIDATDPQRAQALRDAATAMRTEAEIYRLTQTGFGSAVFDLRKKLEEERDKAAREGQTYDEDDERAALKDLVSDEPTQADETPEDETEEVETEQDLDATDEQGIDAGERQEAEEAASLEVTADRLAEQPDEAAINFDGDPGLDPMEQAFARSYRDPSKSTGRRARARANTPEADLERRLRERSTEINTRLEEIDQRLNEPFKGIEDRLRAINLRLDELNEETKKNRRDPDALTRIADEMIQLKEEKDGLNEERAQLKKEVRDLDKERAEIVTKLGRLTQTADQERRDAMLERASDLVARGRAAQRKREQQEANPVENPLSVLTDLDFAEFDRRQAEKEIRAEYPEPRHPVDINRDKRRVEKKLTDARNDRRNVQSGAIFKYQNLETEGPDGVKRPWRENLDMTRKRVEYLEAQRRELSDEKAKVVAEWVSRPMYTVGWQKFPDYRSAQRYIERENLYAEKPQPIREAFTDATEAQHTAEMMDFQRMFWEVDKDLEQAREDYNIQLKQQPKGPRDTSKRTLQLRDVELRIERLRQEKAELENELKVSAKRDWSREKFNELVEERFKYLQKRRGELEKYLDEMRKARTRAERAGGPVVLKETEQEFWQKGAGKPVREFFNKHKTALQATDAWAMATEMADRRRDRSYRANDGAWVRIDYLEDEATGQRIEVPRDLQFRYVRGARGRLKNPLSPVPQRYEAKVRPGFDRPYLLASEAEMGKAFLRGPDVRGRGGTIEATEAQPRKNQVGDDDPLDFDNLKASILHNEDDAIFELDGLPTSYRTVHGARLLAKYMIARAYDDASRGKPTSGTPGAARRNANNVVVPNQVRERQTVQIIRDAYSRITGGRGEEWVGLDELRAEVKQKRKPTSSESFEKDFSLSLSALALGPEGEREGELREGDGPGYITRRGKKYDALKMSFAESELRPQRPAPSPEEPAAPEAPSPDTPNPPAPEDSAPFDPFDDSLDDPFDDPTPSTPDDPETDPRSPEEMLVDIIDNIPTLTPEERERRRILAAQVQEKIRQQRTAAALLEKFMKTNEWEQWKRLTDVKPSQAFPGKYTARRTKQDLGQVIPAFQDLNQIDIDLYVTELVDPDDKGAVSTGMDDLAKIYIDQWKEEADRTSNSISKAKSERKKRDPNWEDFDFNPPSEDDVSDASFDFSSIDGDISDDGAANAEPRDYGETGRTEAAGGPVPVEGINSVLENGEPEVLEGAREYIDKVGHWVGPVEPDPAALELAGPKNARRLSDAQIRAITLAIRAYRTAVDQPETNLQGRAFALLDGTGFGKTRVFMAFMKLVDDFETQRANELGRPKRKVAVLVPGSSDPSKNNLVQQYAEDSDTLGFREQFFVRRVEGNKVYYTPKSDTLVIKGHNNTTSLASQYSLLVIDEAHTTFRNEDKSVGIKTPFRMIATASPVDKPGQEAYLLRWLTAMNGDKSFREVDARLAHSGLKKLGDNPTESEINTYEAAYLKVLEDAARRGLVSSGENKREQKYAINQVDNQKYNNYLPDKPEYKKYADSNDHIRQKFPAMAAQALHDIQQNVQPIIAFRKVEHVKEFSDLLRTLLRNEYRDVATQFTEPGGDKPRDIVATLFKETPDANAVQVAFQSGQARILVLTVDRGGAGISLDDRKPTEEQVEAGYDDSLRPRHLMIADMPLQGVSLEQLLGRHDRSSTRTRPYTTMFTIPGNQADIKMRSLLLAKTRLQSLSTGRLGREMEVNRFPPMTMDPRWLQLPDNEGMNRTVPSDPDVLRLVSDNAGVDAVDVLEQVEKRGDRYMRAISRHYRRVPNARGVSVYTFAQAAELGLVPESAFLDDEGKPILGAFQTLPDGTRRIFLNEGYPAISNVLIHEFTHALTYERMISDPSVAARMRALMAALPFELRQEFTYAFQDEFEFVGEAFGNYYFDVALASTRDPLTKQTMWNKFVNLIRSILRLPPSIPRSALDAIIEATHIDTDPRGEFVGALPREYLPTTLARTGQDTSQQRTRSTINKLASDPLNWGRGNYRRLYDAVKSAETNYMIADDVRATIGGAFADKVDDYIRANEVRESEATKRANRHERNVMRPLQEYLRSKAGKRSMTVKLAQTAKPEVMPEGRVLGILMNMAGIGQVDFAESRDAETNRLLGGRPQKRNPEKLTKSTTAARAVWDLYKPIYDQLSDEGKEIYKKIRDHYKTTREEQIRYVVGNYLNAMLGEENKIDWTERTAKEQRKQLADIGDDPDIAESGSLDDLKQLENLLTPNQVPGAYFPLRRFGEYVVTVKGEFEVESEEEARRLASQYPGIREPRRIDGEPKDSPKREMRVHEVYFFDSLAEAERGRESLIERYANDTVLEVSETQQARDAAFLQNAELTPNLIQRFRRRLEQRAGPNMDKDQRKRFDLLQREMTLALLDLQPEQSLASAMRLRKRIPGASTDIERVNATVGQAQSRLLANLKTHRTTEDALASVYRAAKDLEGEQNKQWRAVLVTRKFSERANRTLEESVFNTWQQRLSDLGFGYYLVGASYLMVNTLQVPLFSAPMMAGRHGAAATSAALTRAYGSTSGGILKKLAKTGGTLVPLFKGLARGDFTTGEFDVLEDMLADKDLRGVNPRDRARVREERWALERLMEQGVINVSLAQDLARIGARSRVNADGSARRLSAPEILADWMKQAPHLVEVMNRSVTAVAAYNLEKEKLLRDARKRGKEVDKGEIRNKALEYAKRVVNDTHFVYAPWNRPGIFTNQWVRLAGMFMTHTIHTYYLMMNRFMKTVGMYQATPEERKEAAKALSMFVGLHILVAGVAGGTPEPVKGLIALGMMAMSGLAGEELQEEDDWRLAIRNGMSDFLGPTLGEVAAQGLPTLIGLDLGSRIGLDSLITFGGLETPGDRDTLYRMFFETTTGPLGGLGVRVVDGVQFLKEGQTLKAVEAFTPKVMRDVVRTYRVGTDGFTTPSGIVYASGDELSPLEYLYEGLGFRSTTASDVYLRRAAAGSLQDLRQRRSRLMERYYISLSQGEDVSWFRTAVGDWNRRYGRRGLGISRSDLKRSVEARRRQENPDLGAYVPQRYQGVLGELVRGVR